MKPHKGGTLPPTIGLGIGLMALFWLLCGIALGLAAVALRGGRLGFTATTDGWGPGGLLLAAVASVALGVVLALRRAWARPAAALYHVALTVGLLAALWVAWPYNGLIAVLPPWLTANSWRNLLILITVATALGSALAAIWFSRGDVWQAFARPSPRAPSTCNNCGATIRDKKCPYCDAPDLMAYLLQPILPDTSAIALNFGRGHERLHIGRGVDPREALLDEQEQPAFKTLSRFHAALVLEYPHGQVYLEPDKNTADVRHNGHHVEQRSPALAVGDLIELGALPFLFMTPDYRFQAAYWRQKEDPEAKTLLIFDEVDRDWLIGREDCAVVIPPTRPEISRQHVAITYDEASHCFWILNVSDHNHVTVNGFDLKPSHIEPLPVQQASDIELADRYDYVFEPIPLARNAAPTMA